MPRQYLNLKNYKMKLTILKRTASSISFAVLILMQGAAHAQNWQRITGITAQDIAVSKNGVVWATGTNNVIYKWNNSKWETIPGAASRIAVDTSGNAWVANANGDIYKYQSQTNDWSQAPGKAKDVAVGADGSVWIVGAYPTSGGYEIYKYNGSAWNKISGGAERIAVDPFGMPWITTTSNAIYQYNGASFVLKPGAAKDISVGSDGSIWCTNAGGSIFRWNGISWDTKSGAAANIGVAPDGNAWAVNANGEVWKTTDAATKLVALFTRGGYYEYKMLQALRAQPYVDQVAGPYSSLDPLGQALGRLSLKAAEIYASRYPNATAESILADINNFSDRQQMVSGILGALIVNEVSRTFLSESEILSVTTLKNWAASLYKSFKIRCAKSVLDQYKAWKNDPCSYQADGYTRPGDCGAGGVNIAPLFAGRTPPQDIIAKAGLKRVFGNNAAAIASCVAVGAAAAAMTAAGLSLATMLGNFGGIYFSLAATFGAEISQAGALAGAIGAGGWLSVAAAPVAAIILAVVVGTVEGIQVTEAEKVEPMLKMRLGAAMTENITLANVMADTTAVKMFYLAYMESATQNHFKVTEPRVDGEARFFSQGGYASRFNLSYKVNGQAQTHTTSDLPVGQSETLAIPYNATDIKSEGYYLSGDWHRIYADSSLLQPTYACFTTYGTVFEAKYKRDCPEVGNMTMPSHRLMITHAGAYVAWIRLTYQYNGQPITKLDKNDATSGWIMGITDIPTSATNIRLEAWSATGWVGEPWKKIIDLTWATAPGECIKLLGTTLAPTWNDECN
jgi:hypothetical protein